MFVQGGESILLKRILVIFSFCQNWIHVIIMCTVFVYLIWGSVERKGRAKDENLITNRRKSIEQDIQFSLRFITNINIFLLLKSSLQASGWKKVRSVVSWSPFIQTYKKQRYPWIQLAGHQGNWESFLSICSFFAYIMLQKI